MDWRDFLTEVFNKPSSRNIRLVLSLLFITMAMMIVMTIFSVAKVLINPDITIWQTQLYTIIFTGLLAPVVALFILFKFERLYVKISEENEERKQAEEALRESEEKYRNIVETAGEGIWMSDTNGRTTFVNNRMAEMIGYCPEEMIGKLAYDFMDEEAGAIGRQNLERRRQGLRDIFEQKYIRKDGTTLWAIVSTTSLQDKDSRIIAYLGMLTDITERKRSEEVYRKSEERFRKFFDLPLIGTAITSSEKRFIQVNDKLCEMFGYSREELLKTRWDKITHPEDLAVNFDAFNRLTAGEIETYTFEKRFIHKNGGIVYVILSAACIRREDGTVDYFISTYNDITARKHGEIALQESKDQAEMYLDLMSHDINNMNQIAIGFLELAQEASTLEDTKELISKPLDSLHSSSKLIENVNKLQRSRLEPLKRHAVDLCDVLLKLQKRYSSLPGRDIVIDFVPVPGCLVIANALMEDVFSNLISNSIKHSETDRPLKIHLGISIVGEDSTRYYKVIVEDNGPGIPDSMKAKLFMRFQRGTTKASGKGLGLYLVKTLVDDFNGRVRVEDRIPGDHTKGARFEVIIPALE